jgi:L-lactate dehydrogenase complex protein LldG
MDAMAGPTSSPEVVDLVETFVAQARRIGAQVSRALPAEAVSAVVRALGAAGCGTVALADDLPDRDALSQALQTAGLAVRSTADLWPTRRADGGVSLARLGVAETGSVLLHSSSENRRVELCVDVHLVLLAVDRLVAELDAAFRVLREISLRPPAYATLVSGPSRSADIERQLTIGVHGPRALHILLLEVGA